jgi:uncharacterized repeat protein (TIGR02543 family)
MTLYARWIGQVCFVAFNTNGGTKVDTLFAEQGDFLTEPVTSREGYLFFGWYVDEECEIEWDFENDMVVGDMTLYAKWNVRTYIVTFDSREGTAVPPQTINHGGKAEKPTPDPTRQNYTFRGWYKDQIGINEWNFNTEIVLANTTLYARWQLGTDIAKPEQATLQVYPNPFSDEIYIIDAKAGSMVFVVNMNGIVVHAQKITNPNQTIHLKHLPKGVYILQVDNHTTRIVKQ